VSNRNRNRNCDKGRFAVWRPKSPPSAGALEQTVAAAVAAPGAKKRHREVLSQQETEQGLGTVRAERTT
jgi:hypothetical protein